MNHSVYQWIKQGRIKPDQQQQALELIGERAGRANWLSFSGLMLVSLGALALAAGVVFFFAFNWNEMGRMFKFMTLQVLLLAFFAAYFYQAKSSQLTQIWLLAATLVLGALLALFGQTYQTGADPWQLFATWAVLILPVVLFARSELMWLVWAVLLNTALGLYLDLNRSIFGINFISRYWDWIYLLLNAVILGALIYMSYGFRRCPDRLQLNQTWAAQLMGLVVIAILAAMGSSAIWGKVDIRAAKTVTFILGMAIAFVFYRFKAKDLLLISAWISALTFVVLTFVARHVLDDFEAGGFLLMAVLLLGASAGAVKWIKHLQQQFKYEAKQLVKKGAHHE